MSASLTLSLRPSSRLLSYSDSPVSPNKLWYEFKSSTFKMQHLLIPAIPGGLTLELSQTRPTKYHSMMASRASHSRTLSKYFTCKVAASSSSSSSSSSKIKTPNSRWSRFERFYQRQLMVLGDKSANSRSCLGIIFGELPLEPNLRNQCCPMRIMRFFENSTHPDEEWNAPILTQHEAKRNSRWAQSFVCPCLSVTSLFELHFISLLRGFLRSKARATKMMTTSVALIVPLSHLSYSVLQLSQNTKSVLYFSLSFRIRISSWQ